MQGLRDNVNSQLAIVLGGVAFATSGLAYVLHPPSSSPQTWCDYVPVSFELLAQALLSVGFFGLVVKSLSRPAAGNRRWLVRTGCALVGASCLLWFIGSLPEFVLSIPYSSTFDFLGNVVLLSIGLVIFAFFGISPVDISPSHSEHSIARKRLLPLIGVFLTWFVFFAADSSFIGIVLWVLFGCFWIAMSGLPQGGHEGVPQIALGMQVEEAMCEMENAKTHEDEEKSYTALSYLEAVRDSIKSTEESLRRTMILLFGQVLKFL